MDFNPPGWEKRRTPIPPQLKPRSAFTWKIATS